MYEHLLRNIGLTENEAKTYLSLLQIGLSTTSKIIDAAEISSGKIYETLDKLYKKGLVSVTQINGVKHFQTTHPNALINLIQEQKTDLNQKENQLSNILPKLADLQHIPPTPFSTETLIGIRSIKPLIIDLFNNSKKTINAMGIRGTKSQKYNNFWWHITVENIEKNNKKARYLFSENTSEYHNKHKKLKNVETKYIESLTPVAIDIIDDHIIILTYEEKLKCVHIHNKAIADSFRSFFMSLWSQAMD